MEDALLNDDEEIIRIKQAPITFTDNNLNDPWTRTQIRTRLRSVYASSPEPYVLRQQYRVCCVKYAIDICDDYRVRADTWWKAVELIDRYMATRTGTGEINRLQMQLTVLACVLIACKFEEVLHPSIQSLCDTTEGVHSVQQIKDAEWQVFEQLDYRLYTYAPHLFIGRLVEAEDRPGAGWANSIVSKHASLFADIALFVFVHFDYAASSIGLACFCCALWNLRELDKDDLFQLEETVAWAMDRYSVAGEMTPQASNAQVRECIESLTRSFTNCLSAKQGSSRNLDILMDKHIQHVLGWKRVEGARSRKRGRGEADAH